MDNPHLIKIVNIGICFDSGPKKFFHHFTAILFPFFLSKLREEITTYLLIFLIIREKRKREETRVGKGEREMAFYTHTSNFHTVTGIC